MTLPTDIDLPLPGDVRWGRPEDVNVFLRNLVNRLEDMYEDIAENVNGYIRPWTPIVYGTSTAGTATYSRQYGWLRRSGIITELWIDVAWSSHSGTGNTAILMPYQAASSQGSPWIGIIESSSSNNTFGAGYTYLTWRCEPDTTQGSIIKNGTGVASTGLALAAAGGVRGYIQYIGKEFET